MTSLFGKKPVRPESEWNAGNTEDIEKQLEQSPEALGAQRALIQTLRQEWVFLRAELGSIKRNVEKGTVVKGTEERIRELEKRVIEKENELRAAQERLQRNEAAQK